MDIQHGNAFFARLLAPRRVMQRMDLHATAAVTFYAMASTAQDQQLLGICRRCRHDDLEAGDMGEPGLEILRMGRTLAPSSTYNHSDN